MPLTLEIEFLGGVCYAASDSGSGSVDWPPQPDRVFSALVATWAAHGRPDDERQALRWLEETDAPTILASGATGRTAVVAYVPPNDYTTPAGDLAQLSWFRDSVSRAVPPRKDSDGWKKWRRAWAVMPDERKRSGLKARHFPASRPDEPIVRHRWSAEPDAATLHALQSLARDTAYVGHSSSLTRCRFAVGDDLPGDADWRTPWRRVYPGRIAELEAAYSRFERSADRKDRPAPGAPVAIHARSEKPSSNVFSDRWLVLEHLGGRMPDLRAAPLVARGIRVALMSGYGQIGQAVPPEIAGHEADGSPARAPHMAVVPLAFTGFEHADGRVLGFALVPPAESTLLDDPHFLKALRRLARMEPGGDRRVIEVRSPCGTAAGRAFALRLTPVFELPNRVSLDPLVYSRAARDFATVTPIVLDRHPKSHGADRQEEFARLVASACGRIGLPEPTAVQVGAHAAVEGAPSVHPPSAGRSWMNWQLPESLARRPMTHAFIRFATPVPGPLLLGAGRFVGMGLCRPLDRSHH